MAILVTGATGFLGQHVIENLVHQTRRIIILVRPQSLERARQMFSSYPHLEFLPGDLTESDIITDHAVFDKVKSSIHTVMHLAANYDLQGPKDKAYVSNVVGTHNMIHLLNSLPELQDFHYTVP